VPSLPRGCGHVRLLADIEREKQLSLEEPDEPPALVELKDTPEPWRPHRDQLGSQP
jgi:hypothetical protein